MKFCVYVDYTKESLPRPFYVGKGTSSRVLLVKRNKKHAQVVEDFGIDRRVVFETDDEELSFVEEKRHIAELYTFIADENASEIACNMTKGGSGMSGINKVPVALISTNGDRALFESTALAAEFLEVAPEVIGRISTGRGRKTLTVKGYTVERLGLVRNKRKKNATTWTRKSEIRGPHSEETKRVISEALKGIKRSKKTRTLLSKARSKQVFKIDLMGNVVQVFESTIAARAHLNISKTTMLNIIHSKRVYQGYIWAYDKCLELPVEVGNP